MTRVGGHAGRPGVWWLIVGCDYRCPACKKVFENIPEYPRPTNSSVTQVPAWCLPCQSWLERVA